MYLYQKVFPLYLYALEYMFHLYKVLTLHLPIVIVFYIQHPYSNCICFYMNSVDVIL